MSMPLCSAVMPAYNCEKTVEASIRSALEQGYPNLEIVVVEDHSTDNTLALLRALAKQDSRIRVVTNEKNLGVEETRNRGFAHAKGKYIALLDADDLWLPEKLALQVALMEEKGCDFSYTGYTFMDEGGTPLEKVYTVPESISFKGMLRENVVGNSTVMLTAEIAGNYKQRAGWGHEDYVFWMELLRDGKTACGIPQPLMRYRLSAESRSGDKKKAAKNRWRIYRQFLEMGRFSSLWAFVGYAWNGIKKHR